MIPAQGPMQRCVPTSAPQFISPRLNPASRHELPQAKGNYLTSAFSMRFREILAFMLGPNLFVLFLVSYCLPVGALRHFKCPTAPGTPNAASKSVGSSILRTMIPDLCCSQENDVMLDTDAARSRLATYGTLAPGKPNHHQLAGLQGEWRQGTVLGHLVDKGWGAAAGFPGLVLDEQGGEIAVMVFESAELPAHWQRLDDFEGEGYDRVVVTVNAGGVSLLAYIYAIAP
jgi:gamma-glutamylcyclotransferase (GGCT)/AIG2-like uncharacterized protein YtfP